MSWTEYLPSRIWKYHLRGRGLTKKTGLVYPVPPTLSFLLDDILASCFNSPNSQARIRRKKHVRLTSTRRVVKRGYAASYFNSQSIGARIRYHPISSTDTFLILSVAPSATYKAHVRRYILVRTTPPRYSSLWNK